jgi:hypothetical protein
MQEYTWMFHALTHACMGHSAHELGSLSDWESVACRILPVVEDVFGSEVIDACLHA